MRILLALLLSLAAPVAFASEHTAAPEAEKHGEAAPAEKHEEAKPGEKHGEGGGEHGGEHKAKPDEKPTYDSILSKVMQLKEIKEWREWLTTQDGVHLDAWGETLSAAEGKPCWSVAVGKVTEKNSYVWKRFCVSASGKDVWAEMPDENQPDIITYLPYADWVKRCKPTFNSPGKC